MHQSGQQLISQVQAHMEHCSSIFVYQCSFQSGHFSSPERFGAVVFKHSSTLPTLIVFYSPFPHNQCWLEPGMGAHGWVAGICQPWGLYSIWGLAGLSGSPWIPQAPTFHLSEAAVKYIIFALIAIARTLSRIRLKHYTTSELQSSSPRALHFRVRPEVWKAGGETAFSLAFGQRLISLNSASKLMQLSSPANWCQQYISAKPSVTKMSNFLYV